MSSKSVKMPVTYEELDSTDVESDGGLSKKGDIILVSLSAIALIAGCCVGGSFLHKSRMFADDKWVTGVMTTFTTASATGLPLFIGIMDCVKKGELMGNKNWSNTKN